MNLGRSARLLALLLPGLASGQVCTNGKVRVSVQDNAGQAVSDVAVKLEGGSGAAMVRSDSIDAASQVIEVGGSGRTGRFVRRERVEARDSAPAVERNSTDSNALQADQVKDMPGRPLR